MTNTDVIFNKNNYWLGLTGHLLLSPFCCTKKYNEDEALDIDEDVFDDYFNGNDYVDDEYEDDDNYVYDDYNDDDDYGDDVDGGCCAKRLMKIKYSHNFSMNG